MKRDRALDFALEIARHQLRFRTAYVNGMTPEHLDGFARRAETAAANGDLARLRHVASQDVPLLINEIVRLSS